MTPTISQRTLAQHRSHPRVAHRTYRFRAPAISSDFSFFRGALLGVLLSVPLWAGLIALTVNALD